MVRLTIDGREVEVPSGTRLLDAARGIGVDVPSLCYLKETGVINSCMVCVVQDRQTGRMIPSCSTMAEDGMEIASDSPEVHAARHDVLELLLSEHVGDCEAPCKRACPAGMDIPRMLRYLQHGDEENAARLARRDLVFPATLGYLCTAPCQGVCRRGTYDVAVEIRAQHRAVAERCAVGGELPEDPVAATGSGIGILGAGMAGLAAAYTCLRSGHACRIYEKGRAACEAIRSIAPDDGVRAVLDAEINHVVACGAEILFEHDVTVESVAAHHDAVIVTDDDSATASGNVFVARDDAMFVRSVARGKAAARRADAWLRGRKEDPTARRFDSRIGSVRDDEKAAYALERKAAGDDTETGEAGRCLHCDCLKRVSCKLRRYADVYALRPQSRLHMERPPIEPIRRHDDLVFEPGKCIKCGICVELTRAAGISPGMTFVGRGLASRVRVPFMGPLGEGLGPVAEHCVRACPTGALAFLSEEDTA